MVSFCTFTYTLKTFLSKLVIKCCLSSTTVACSTTSSTSARKTNPPGSVSGGAGAGGCPWGLPGAPLVCAPLEVGCAGLVDAGFGLVVSWAPVPMLKKNRVINRVRRRLLGGCIVSRLGIHTQRRQSFGRYQLHFYLTPFAVTYRILWTVSEHI